MIRFVGVDRDRHRTGSGTRWAAGTAPCKAATGATCERKNRYGVHTYHKWENGVDNCLETESVDRLVDRSRRGPFLLVTVRVYLICRCVCSHARRWYLRVSLVSALGCLVCVDSCRTRGGYDKLFLGCVLLCASCRGRYGMYSRQV